MENIEPQLSPLKITIKNQLFLDKKQVSKELLAYLTKKLIFINMEYLLKKKMGKSIYKVERYFKAVKEYKETIVIPRGFARQLLTFLKEHSLPYQIIDERNKLPLVRFSAAIQLYPYQQECLKSVEKKEFGVIVAPPGSGKTIMGLEIISRKSQPALILVHRKQLLNQWIERIQSFLKIPKKDIGQISGSKKKTSTKITVAMLQSLTNKDVLKKVKDQFGTILVDECHHIPAKTFRAVIVHFNPQYLYGFTATPQRKYNDEKLIFVYIGDIIATVPYNQLNENAGKEKLHIVIKETNLSIPFNHTIDDLQTLSKIIIYDSSRNTMITSDIAGQVSAGKKILVLTERKEHIDVLYLYLKNKFEIIVITGDDSLSQREEKIKEIENGDFHLVISTGQFFGEGMDIKHLDCLFLVYPFAFEGKLIQYIGRIQRSTNQQIIFDYRDKHIAYLEKLFKERSKYYKKLNLFSEI